MTPEKTPALLAIVIKTRPQQWYVAEVGMDAAVHPLVRSEPGDLGAYVGKSDDDQLSILRHRISGAMQRGCDRLWARNAKATRIVLIADDDFPDADAALLQRLADHLHTWMTSPPVSCYRGHGEATIEDLESLECLVDHPEPDRADSLRRALPELARLVIDSDGWEVIARPKA